MPDLYNYQPVKPFSQKHLLCLQAYSADEIFQTLAAALKLKAMQKKGLPHPILKDKTLAMIFTKSSTRTRVSFEVGIHQLGGKGLFLSGADIQIGRGETISDTARVLSRYVDGIMIRTFKQSDVEGLAKYGSVPVINGLTDDYHPCQALADLMTVYEHIGGFEGRKLAFVGDGNNMAHSLLIGSSKVGMSVSIASPKAYFPNPKVVSWAEQNAKAAGSGVLCTADPKEAIRDADVVYTDVWASMGQEEQAKERIQAFQGYQVNRELFALAKPNAIFLHCLPAHRGEEVTSEVIDGPNSVIFDEAENRLHTQKAAMALLMKDEGEEI